MLDETCRILRRLWTEGTASFAGGCYSLREAALDPKPLQRRLPLLIAGTGERRMLRIVAEHADIWNAFATDIDSWRSKHDALAAHCAELGRPPEDIRKSLLFRVVLAETEREAEQRLDSLVGTTSPQERRAAGYLAVGTPTQCVDRLRPYFRLGVGDFLLGMRTPVDWQTIELFVRDVAPALRAEAP